MQAILLCNGQPQLGRYKFADCYPSFAYGINARAVPAIDGKRFPKKSHLHDRLPAVNKNIPLFQHSSLSGLYNLLGFIRFLVLNHQDTHFIKKIERNGNDGQCKRVASGSYNSGNNNNDNHCMATILP